MHIQTYHLTDAWAVKKADTNQKRINLSAYRCILLRNLLI